MTTTTHNAIETSIRRAEKLGKRHGRNAAEWITQDAWGGRCTRGSVDNARAFLAGYDDGDPLVMDAYRAPDLSGEFADDMTEARLMDHCFDDEADYADAADAHDDICLAYTDAASEAFWDELQRSAAAVIESAQD
jgi:hypothetical protein